MNGRRQRTEELHDVGNSHSEIGCGIEQLGGIVLEVAVHFRVRRELVLLPGERKYDMSDSIITEIEASLSIFFMILKLNMKSDDTR